MKCLICNENKCSIVKKVDSPYNNNLYDLYTCPICNSMFFEVKENDDNLETMYDEIGRGLSHTEFRTSLYWKEQVKKINRLSKGIKNILDIGCRTGNFLMHFPNSINRKGVELSNYSANIARSRGIDVYQDFIENLQFNEKFDCVTNYAVLEHLRDPCKYILEISSLVADNGILLIMIPTHQSFKRWLIDKFTSHRWHQYCPPSHINFISKSELDKILNENGFILANRYYTSGGMFNPFKGVPILKKVGAGVMFLIDYYTPINKLPIFDHMYSYYIKK